MLQLDCYSKVLAKDLSLRYNVLEPVSVTGTTTPRAKAHRKELAMETANHAWQDKIDHRLDDYNPQQRFDEDVRVLAWYHREGLYGTLYIENQYCGTACFVYRLGNYSGSTRYRLVGRVVRSGWCHNLYRSLELPENLRAAKRFTGNWVDYDEASHQARVAADHTGEDWTVYEAGDEVAGGGVQYRAQPASEPAASWWSRRGLYVKGGAGNALG